MGQKVNPIGLRVGINKTWLSRWYSKSDYRKFFLEDIKIRRFLEKKLENKGLARVEIERYGNDKLKVIMHSSRPGMVIGKGGTMVESLKLELKKMTDAEVFINIRAIKDPDTEAKLVAENISVQLENRIAFRKAMKRTIDRMMKNSAIQGVKIKCSGRLGGAEMSRCEWYQKGRVPLHTLRADIDYGVATAKTIYGSIGVKVWVFKGDIFDDPEEANAVELLSV